ncbi:hypothetical protein ACFOLJ_28925 [Rugamonas sp. CCM 8940]|uniref:hypothetical protein n=1 Tax=Rugamonas sp. CCM 8940 TaxID=2765359 RepID=UPI0018F78A2E|nr:hypothetical protein [Rugamonas sp. CCM 8940]MBJ7313757.1 hypothetical protein [Rugamonas sp. CCM 8940]
MRRLPALLLALALAHSPGRAQTAAAAPPFADKPLAAAHLRVDSPAQFVKWAGKPLKLNDEPGQVFEKTRLGTVSFGPNLKVHVDAIRNTVHFPSTYQLVDAASGALLGSYDVFDLDDAEWYFAGNGAAYLNQTHLSLCGQRYTRKIAQKGKALAETVQPLNYIGVDSAVEKATALYESPSSRVVVATVAAGSTVHVIGLLPGTSAQARDKLALLVKTPFGLTGWHRLDYGKDEAGLAIYQCN